jgi:glycosyltransferase involved in cell wall biosynthesis
MSTKRIHLLFIVSSLGFGGAEKHVVTLANNLDPTRFKLSVAYLKTEDDLLPQLDCGRIDGRVFCCNVTHKMDMQAVRLLAAHIRDDAVDVVACINAFPLLYGWLARMVAGLRPRVVVIFHTTQLNSIKDKLQMLVYWPFFWFSDMLVYVCENQRKFWRFRALRARKDIAIHNGIDVDLFADHYSNETKALLRSSYGFQSGDFLVGICALFRPEKAHGDLLQAVSRLRESGLNVKCLLIGDGPLRTEIETKIDQLGLASHVRITGLLADVRPAIAACNVMAIVSHNVETFSIAALESMALGKAMVMTDIGGASEQIVHGRNGYLYPCGDITALTSALHQFMESEEHNTMGTRARSIVAQQFSLGVMVDAYDSLFVRLANCHD